MEHPANSIQNPAKYEACRISPVIGGSSFNTGFLFDTPRSFALANCAHCSRTRPAGVTRCNAYPPGHWVLDYSIAYRDGTDFFCGTEASGMLLRPERIAHLYPPDLTYFERNDRTCWMSSAWMIFASDDKLLYTLCDNPFGFARIHDPSMEIGRRLEHMASLAAAGGNGNYFRCGAIAFEILSELAAAKSVDGSANAFTTAKGYASASVPMRTTCYLESHFRERITVPEMARALGMSASTLSHRFREETGETIIQALQRVRLEQSIPYLRRGTPLKEIAAATGFLNAFYYSKVFRRHYGMPPGEWRNKDT